MSDTSMSVSVCISSMVKHFESLPDPRHTRNRRHLLVDVMTLAVCGVIVGCSGPSAIERWAKAKKDWLKELLALPNGIPSRDCIRRVLSALKPEAFQTCLSATSRHRLYLGQARRMERRGFVAEGACR